MAASPVAVGGSLLLGTTVLDQVLVSATIVLTVRALRTRRLAAWIMAGVVAGIALENKQTVVVFVAGTLLGLLVTRRDTLRDAGPWVAGVVALLLWLPNLLWNALNGWPSVDMARVIADEQGGLLVSFAQLPIVILAVAGLLVVVWVPGVIWLLRDPGTPASLDGRAWRVRARGVRGVGREASTTPRRHCSRHSPRVASRSSGARGHTGGLAHPRSRRSSSSVGHP